MLLDKNEFLPNLHIKPFAEEFKTQSKIYGYFNCFLWPLSKRTWALIATVAIVTFVLNEVFMLLPFLSGDVYFVMGWCLGVIMIAHFIYHFKFGQQAIIMRNKLILPDFLTHKGMPREVNFDAIKSIDVKRTSHSQQGTPIKIWWKVNLNMSDGQVIKIIFLNFLSLPSLVAYLILQYHIPVSFESPKIHNYFLWTMLSITFALISYVVFLKFY